MELTGKRGNSCIVHLAAKGKMSVTEEKCKYYLCRHAFPMKMENKMNAIKDVEEWIVMLAFPCGKRLRRGTSSSCVFTFLPTAMVTNFSFIIQADLVLSSSRETIVLDNRWNLGILECIPEAFLNAFITCVKSSPTLFSLSQAFEFLHVTTSPITKFNSIRDSIKAILQRLKFVPCSYLPDFQAPSNVVRILHEFQDLLYQLKRSGAQFSGLSSLKMHVLVDEFDNENHNMILDFLVVEFGNCE